MNCLAISSSVTDIFIVALINQWSQEVAILFGTVTYSTIYPLRQ